MPELYPSATTYPGTTTFPGSRVRTFAPPVVVEPVALSPGELPLWSKLKMQLGVTVLKTAGSYRSVISPSPEEISAADIAYIGGHVYPITDQEAAELTAAGYEVIAL